MCPAKMCKHNSVLPSLGYSTGASSKSATTSLAALPALVVGIGSGLKVWLSVTLTDVKPSPKTPKTQTGNDRKH